MGFAPTSMQLTSPAFQNHSAIPSKFTGEGMDVSPELHWSDVPDGTKGFAVICHDPDAPLVSPNGTYGFVHWVLYNIPATVNSLEEGVQGFSQGKTDFGTTGYGGPMPPNGHGTHLYYFWVLALDTETSFPDGLTLWQLLEEIEPHVIGMNRLIGSYKRD